MKLRAIVERAIVILAYVAILACQGQGQAEQKSSAIRGRAARVLHRYVQLRLQDADWKEYSQLITWPDEPSWDCKWVVAKHEVGVPVEKEREVVIPVVYSRLGLFCYDFDFRPDESVVTIKYELVRHQNGWQVNAPIPEYPDIGADVVIKSMNAIAMNTNETPKRRAEADAAIRNISGALKQETTTSPKLRAK
jgi:hypothetical protein